MDDKDPYDIEYFSDFNRKKPIQSGRKENNRRNRQTPIQSSTRKPQEIRQSQKPQSVASNLKKENVQFTTRISLTKVNDFLKEDPDHILLKIQDKHFGLDMYLEADRMGTELVNSFSALLLKSFQCNSMNTVTSEIKSKLANSSFYKSLLYEAIEKKNKNGEFDIELIKNAIDLTVAILTINPGIKNMLEFMFDRLELICRMRSNNKELEKYYERIEELKNKKKEEPKEGMKKAFVDITNQDAEPPNKITDISIMPKLEDLINDSKPFLRQNVTNGAYRSVEHYLDVQFRLLREDFIQPLREGVKQLRFIIDSEKAKLKEKFKINKEFELKLKKEINSINVYYDIKMYSNVTTNVGLVYSMRLSPNKKIDWERSKRLIFGSLVCFSKDYFQSHCVVGTICERDVKKLQDQGDIYVKFEYESFDLKNLPKIDETYIMIEASAYFESYKHVLDAFVSFYRKGEEEFPFKENIVYCQNKEMSLPAYLKDAYIDFGCLIDKNKKTLVDHPKNLNRYEFEQSLKYVKKLNDLPNADQLEFDESQYNALKLALTNKLVLIQGPPGCGKTFIGVKIVDLLLSNKRLWWNNEKRTRPILMICYTNHALDQFLELIVDKCNLKTGVVRVGGRSKSEKLEPFLLHKIKSQIRKDRSFDPHIFYNIRNALDRLDKIKSEINNSTKLIDECDLGIVSMEYLEPFIDHDSMSEFNQISNGNFYYIKTNRITRLNLSLLQWLGFFKVLNDSQEEKVETELNKINLQDSNNEAEDDQDDFTDTDDEDRMLEDDFDISIQIKELKLNRTNEVNRFNNENIPYLEKLEKCKMVIYEPILSQISKLNNDGWTTVGEKNNKSIFFRKIQMLADKSDKEIDTTNILELKMENRYILYNKWLIDLKKSFQSDVDRLQIDYNDAAAQLQEIRMQEDKSIMEKALIIAMTTTGSARYHSILNDIAPRIIIVEEAAEVFEAHIVSALSKKCEHLILIGDHLQLRPNPTVFTLAKDYKVDVSLFERLLNNDCKKEMLTVQHRMRPEISVLLRHFYGNNTIKDDESVLKFPSIRGLTKNVFFINHKNSEKRTDGTTKINEFEAEYLAALANYLVKQHYAESQITILSMYLGQLFEIKNILKKKYKLNIKVSTVDNFQGEENDIILLSLVRSNKEQKIGFLSIENRVNVALSRAKHGLFVIGNFSFIADLNKKWNDIVKRMKDADLFGDNLELTCGNHPKNNIMVSKINDFESRPEGGCKLPCNFRLPCGHNCRLLCHTYTHDNYECKSVCNKPISKCGHNCIKKCKHEKSCDSECTQLVEKLMPGCGHKTLIKCHLIPERKHCVKECDLILQCGHKCINKCFEIPCKPCSQLIKVESICHHKGQIEVKCSDPKFEWQKACKKQCSQILLCGHKCKGICGKDCFSGYLHKKCLEQCDKTLVCGHKCMEKCSDKCSPCSNKCENKCFHSECKKLCGFKCDKCMEKCPVKCIHKKCSLACHQQCDMEPCNEPCDSTLDCGHKCMGLCGEKCPKICFKCEKKDTTINPTFVVLVDCDHIFEKNILDNWVENNFEKNQSLKLPKCPKCNKEICKTQRYINYVKKYNYAIETSKAKQFGSQVELKFQKRRIKEKIQKLTTIATLKYNVFLKNLIKRLEEQNDLNTSQLEFLNKKFDLFIKLNDLMNRFNLKFKSDSKYSGMFKFEYDKLVPYLISNNQSNTIRVNKQETDDLTNEIERLEKVFDYLKVECYIKKQIVYLTLNYQDIEHALTLLKRLEENLILKVNNFNTIENEVASTFDSIYQLLNTSKSSIDKFES